MSITTQLTAQMGQLLGPKPVQEIVITRYADDRVNFQIEGMHAPVTPQDAYQLLSLVASQLATQIPAPQEAPQTHE